MKKLILSVLSMMLLAIQVHAQTQQPIGTQVSTSQSTSVSKSVTRSSSTSTNGSTHVDISTSSSSISYSDQEGEDPLRTKKFTKSFNLDKSDKVNLDNEYGNITIKTWDKNEIKVDAEIKAYANTEAEAQKLLDATSIIATKTGDLASFKTEIENNTRNGWNWGRGDNNGKKWRREVKIYLTVYMPSSNSLMASQSYGSIIIPDFSGPTSLKVEYGNIIAENLSNANNYISVEYGKATAKNINQAKIRLQYGGGLTITSIGNLDLSAEYTSIKIAELKGNAINKVEYGTITIDQVSSGCKSLDIRADYSKVNLGFNENFNADFTVATDYGGFKYPSTINVKRIGDSGGSWSSSKKYTGQIGKGGSAKVTVNADYTAVNFK